MSPIRKSTLLLLNWHIAGKWNDRALQCFERDIKVSYSWPGATFHLFFKKEKFAISSCVFLCHITLYPVAVFLFPNNVTPTGGGRETRSVGRVRPLQGETQISQPRTEKPRAGDELSRAVSSRKIHQYQTGNCVNGAVGNSSTSMRGGKALKEEPGGHTKAWSDLMTPDQEELGCLRSSPAATTPSQAVGEPGSPRCCRKGHINHTRLDSSL